MAMERAGIEPATFGLQSLDNPATADDDRRRETPETAWIQGLRDTTRGVMRRRLSTVAERSGVYLASARPARQHPDGVVDSAGECRSGRGRRARRRPCPR